MARALSARRAHWRTTTTRLDDEQIERYSRQLILQEVGPRGQERLGRARVAIVGSGTAAERVVAYLAAAGIGWIAAEPALHAAVDPAQPDCTIAPLADAEHEPLDAVVVSAVSVDAAAAIATAWQGRAASTHWIAGGGAGALPPCPRCAAAAAPLVETPPELTAVRDALLGTVVATEVVKALLAIGTPLSGSVLGYDPTTAVVTRTAVTARPSCGC